jgi:hypothetical protein
MKQIACHRGYESICLLIMPVFFILFVFFAIPRTRGASALAAIKRSEVRNARFRASAGGYQQALATCVATVR